jgi:hypothetical protein
MMKVVKALGVAVVLMGSNAEAGELNTVDNQVSTKLALFQIGRPGNMSSPGLKHQVKCKRFNEKCTKDSDCCIKGCNTGPGGDNRCIN